MFSALFLPLWCMPSPTAAPVAADYSFGTLNNPGDATFNELLSINNRGHIGGYFGSGAAGHPNTGYILRPPYGRAKYQRIMFPGSAQTRLTGLNNTYYWLDPVKKIAGVFMTQTLPFADPTVLAALDSFENAVYRSVG